MKDFTYLKEGDRINIRFAGMLIRNLLITEVNEKCLVVENIYPFSRKSGMACDITSDNMVLVRGDEM